MGTTESRIRNPGETTGSGGRSKRQGDMRERVEVRQEEGRLVVRRRPPGPVAQGFVMIATGLLWGVVAVLILRSADGCLPMIILGFITVFLLAFLHFAKAAWRFEATSDRVDFIREGLL